MRPSSPRADSTAAAPLAEAPPPAPPPVEAPLPGRITTASGLIIEDTRVGTGATPQPGQTVVVHYTGYLEGTDVVIDSSDQRGQPVDLPFGKGAIIKGWEEGLATMRVGGARTLIIPADLAYGDRGAGGKIPPGATLRFDLELLDLRDPPSP